ncbi:hypothetical protein F7R91_20160 [Streptomyces luteolifulvus]|uniref:Hemopexin n=1 Tax=Streptomyces luteolifulvus TaxID=2615112 RepID=A0A6H9UWR8_9ACTN|nr:hemopexin repeat-containing protein [Streptomyces luteolifulvus]KAB1144992.1 hypothetical protein F7R91_20160 [Streptomyces luteolifulvus]
MAYIFDTALNGRGAYAGKAYFFRDDRYVRYDWALDRADYGPFYVSGWNLPGAFTTGVDAALNGGAQHQGKAYFFRGDKYVTYDWNTNQGSDPGPLSQWNLPPSFASGIDTAIDGQGAYAGKAYFFKDDQYVTYDWATGQTEGPSPQSPWSLPGTFRRGVHAALNGEGAHQGKAYFFRGPQYVRRYWSTGAVQGPIHISAWNLRGAIGS